MAPLNNTRVQSEPTDGLLGNLAEVALVFCVFFIQGTWPVPEVNEPYYLSKAIHFWNPDWVGEDFFLDSADTHQVFYFTFGWLSRYLSPVVLAWTGRLLTWALLAWSWWRLSRSVLPRRWWSILAAALLVMLTERCHLAGEWIIGGVEAKGFAFVFVFLALEALTRARWNWAFALFGAAACFHVLIGGWAIVATGFALLFLPEDRPRLATLWPGLTLGMLFSLPSLIPSLGLTWAVDPEIVRQANYIYVFERLPHHLFPTHFIVRFSLLVIFWLLLCRTRWGEPPESRLRAFVFGTLVIGGAGMIIALSAAFAPDNAAGLLRFYWFRLVDVAVPMGVALGGASYIAYHLQVRPAWGKLWLGIVVALCTLHLGVHAVRRPLPTVPRADRLPHYRSWRLACRWIAQSGEIPADACFLTPRLAQTFKWYTGRAEVVTWKDIPQDPRSIVAWWNRLQDIHATGSMAPDERWRESLAELDEARLRALGRKYGANYLLTRTEPPLDLEVLYRNRHYVVYCLDQYPLKKQNIEGKRGKIKTRRTRRTQRKEV